LDDQSSFFLSVNSLVAMPALYHTWVAFVHRTISTSMLYNRLMSTATRTRLTMDQKLRAIAYIARGDTMSQVAAHLLEDFQVEITESALYKIKKDNAETIQKIQERLADSAAADADALLKSSRVALAKKMQRADRDGNELELLDQQYRAGEIDKSEYQRKKAGLLSLSVSELVNISRTMHAQIIKQPGAPALPEGPGTPAHQPLPAGASTPARLESLLKAIQSGNHVEIQRIVFNGAPANDKPVAV